MAGWRRRLETASAWSCGVVPGSSDDVVVGSGIVTIHTASEVRGLILTGGILDGPGDLDVRGPLVWEGGAMSGTGVTRVWKTAELRGPATKGVGRRVSLAGATTWAGGTIEVQDGGGELFCGHLCDFADTATEPHAITRIADPTGASARAAVYNESDWRVLSAGTRVDADFYNGGISGGTLDIGGGGLTLGEGTRFVNRVMGTLTGTSLLDFTSAEVVTIDYPFVEIGGFTRPAGAGVAGTLPVRGLFVMAEGHVLDLDVLGGPNDHDQIHVEDGHIHVSGQLRVRVLELGLVDVGTTVPVISTSGGSTVFGCYDPEEIVVTGPDGVTPASYDATATCTAHGVVLTVTSNPTAGEDDPLDSAASFVVTGANPFSGRTSLTLAVPASDHVTVAAFDALGRRVAVLFDGAVGPGQSVPVVFDAGALPAGSYVVRATGNRLAFSQTLTLVR